MAARDPQLKKIPVSQLRLGMHLHALDGDWLQHPFWKTSFLLSSEADLRKLHASAVSDCWIDLARGRDVDAADGAPVADEPGTGGAVPVPIPIPIGLENGLDSGRGRVDGRTARSADPAAAPVVGAVADGTDGADGAGAPKPAAQASLPERTSLEEELHHAAALCQASRVAVQSLFAEARLGKAVDAERLQPLVADITDSVLRNAGAMVSLARLKTQDDYSYMHSVAVCALMVALARQMGLDEAACRQAGLAGLLHDLGKAAMPLQVLNKPGRLTEAEFSLIRTHPLRGHEMLQQTRGAEEAALDVCLNHHERMDGAGYPHALPPERISLLARMGAVCDVYDAITSNRPYKRGWDPAESISRMAGWKGQFDPVVFQHFVRSLGIYPTGALVRLASGRLAVVLAQNPQALTLPAVKVFFDATGERFLPPQVIDLAADRSDRIVDREPPTRWNFPHLNALWAGEEVLRNSR